jgi:hypothetical protein
MQVHFTKVGLDTHIHTPPPLAALELPETMEVGGLPAGAVLVLCSGGSRGGAEATAAAAVLCYMLQTCHHPCTLTASGPRLPRP